MENINSEKLSRQAREWLEENSDKVDQILEDLRIQHEKQKSQNIIIFPSQGEPEFVEDNSPTKFSTIVEGLKTRQDSLCHEVQAIKSLLISPRVCKYFENRTVVNSEAPDGQDFIKQITNEIIKLDGSKFIKNFPVAFLMFVSMCLCSWFVVEQTKPLYESLQFPQPAMMAWGSVLMALCFAGIYSKVRSKMIAVMCATIVLYEVLFVGFGTRNNEQHLVQTKHNSLPQVAFEYEQVNRTKSDYLSNKARYEDPNDKVFHNSWFKKTFLDPSWSNYQDANQSLKLVNKRFLENDVFLSGQMWLKLIYRLCAVILSMILSAITIRKLLESFSYS